MIFIHSSLLIFFGLMISFTESTRISAPAPGIVCSPASFNRDKISRVDDFSTLAIMSTSEGDSA